VNDDVVQVGNRYKEVIESALATRSEQSQSSLLGDDLAGLGMSWLISLKLIGKTQRQN